MSNWSLEEDTGDREDDTELVPMNPINHRLNSQQRASFRWDEDKAIESLPEHQFLQHLLLSPAFTDSDNRKEMIMKRINYIKENDDASKLNSLSFYKLAFYRSPAILLTLSIEMVVGIIISQHELTLKKHMLLTSFMPILSSVSGNIGLQASTSTLRSLATGHTSHKSIPDIIKVARKEFMSALLISCCAGMLLCVISGSWSRSLDFGLVTGMSIMISSTIGGMYSIV